jgi:ubiquinone/menaquinone biosynthesis C-methylase UbiE
MTYAMDSVDEFARLERQSRADQYDYRDELRGFQPAPESTILDAGSGSGVVSRYLAERHPRAQVIGVEAAEVRVAQARAAAGNMPNLRFEQGDLRQLTLDTGSVDHVICRYVLQHLQPAVRRSALAEFIRVLKPGGTVTVIDADGFFDNLSPITPFVADFAERLKSGTVVDMWIGRKLPVLLHDAGFAEIDWHIDVMNFKNAAKAREIDQYRERLAFAAPVLDAAFEEPGITLRLQHELFSCLAEPHAVLYYNKFTVTARKPA